MSKNTGGSGGADRGFSIQLNRLADAKGLDAANPTDTDSKDDKAHVRGFILANCVDSTT